MALKQAVELGKALLKFFVVSGVAYFILTAYFNDILHLGIETVPFNIYQSLELLAWIFLALALSLTLIAIVDAPYQVHSHTKELKMTKQEVKDEYKDTEGNPEIKGRIRRVQREMSQRRMMADVPTADVVVTNPTHYSVAIKYDQDEYPVPRVIAKGTDHLAIHIRTIAKENDVPIIESPMLARSLYHVTEVGDDIPDQLFVAVAQVLAYIYQMDQYKKRKGRKPTPLARELPIPKEFRH